MTPEEIKEQRDARCKKLFDLGLKFNGTELFYKDINFHWTDIICMSDKEFDKALEGATKRMEVLKESL
jgi:hypothetical protein